jgi:hypothetical protein
MFSFLEIAQECFAYLPDPCQPYLVVHRMSAYLSCRPLLQAHCFAGATKESRLIPSGRRVEKT